MVSLDSVFASYTPTSADKNRQHIFDNDVLHSLLTKIDNWDYTQRLLFTSFLKNNYGMKVHFCAVKIHTLKSIDYLGNKFFALLTAKLCDETSDRQVSHSQENMLLVLRDTVHCGKY